MPSDVYVNLVRYRLPGATFPLHFLFWQREWRLETVLINGAGSWRCMLEGPQHWFICSAHTQADLERQLTVTGVNISSRTFPGTVFRQLLAQGVAEVLPLASDHEGNVTKVDQSAPRSITPEVLRADRLNETGS